MLQLPKPGVMLDQSAGTTWCTSRSIIMHLLMLRPDARRIRLNASVRSL
jgi:hypothetical protein